MSKSSAEPIPFDELRNHTRWVGILEGTSEFQRKTRDAAHVLREYDREKWGSVLEALRGSSDASDAALLRLQGVSPEELAPFARGDAFFVAPYASILAEYEALLISTLRSAVPPTAIVELGSGLGDKLLKVLSALAAPRGFGGEYTNSGVECGRLLAERRGSPAEFVRFDYNDPSTLSFVPIGALVYTSHSIEQIPELRAEFVSALARRRPAAVYHFEPVYEVSTEDTAIGRMRRRYAEMNDYNRNLLTELRAGEQRGELRIKSVAPDVFSDTPFNTTTIIHWEPS